MVHCDSVTIQCHEYTILFLYLYRIILLVDVRYIFHEKKKLLNRNVKVRCGFIFCSDKGAIATPLDTERAIDPAISH